MTTELSIAEHFGRLAQFGGRCLGVCLRNNVLNDNRLY